MDELGININALADLLKIPGEGSDSDDDMVRKRSQYKDLEELRFPDS